MVKIGILKAVKANIRIILTPIQTHLLLTKRKDFSYLVFLQN